MGRLPEDLAQDLKAVIATGRGTDRTDMPKRNRAKVKQLRSKYWKLLPRDVRQLLWMTDEEYLQLPKEDRDRSAKGWRCGHSLTECGAKPEEAFVLLQASVWNKYRGRQDEAQQIWALIPDAATAEVETAEGYQVQSTRLDTVDLEPTYWLWKDRIPLGEMSLLGAKQGTGKSQFAAWLIAQVTRGELVGEFQDAPRDCLICADEESLAKTIAPRLRAAGADMTRVHALNMRTMGGLERQLELPEDIPYLKAWVRKHQPKLMVLDTLSGFLVGGQKFDSHNEHHVRKALRPLASMAQEMDIAVLGTMHLRKNVSGKDMMMDFLGSVGYTAVSRSALGMTFGPDGGDSDERLMFHVKSNYSGLQDGLRFRMEAYDRLRTKDRLVVKTSRLVLVGDADIDLIELFDEGAAMLRAGASASAREKATAALRELLSGGDWLEVSETDAKLAEEFSCSVRHVRGVRLKMKELEYDQHDGVKMMRLPGT